MKKFKKILSAALALTIVVGMAACGDGDTSNKEKLNLGENYPLQTEERLSYWVALNTALTATVTEFKETELAKELEKRTGVGIDYIHPALGQEQEQFNLLVASGQMPDMVYSNWFEFPGGPDKAINDNYIISLEDYTKDYAPNLSKYLNEHENVNKMVKSDSGHYYIFPTITNDPLLMVTAGPIIRKDLLESLNIPSPVTYDDWYNMLVKFKEAGIEIPYAAQGANKWEIYQTLGILGAEGEFFVDNGTIKYGPMEPEFKETLMMLNKWYNEGLIDRNFTTSDSKIREANILSGKVGVAYGSGGGGLGKWVGALPADSSIKLESVPYPVKNATDAGPKFVYAGSEFNNNGTAVTTACKYPELAVKYLDYMYGEDGHMLMNFGVEGKSYNMVDGKPVYTDLILNNPDGLAVNQAMAQWMMSYNVKSMIQDVGYITQYYALDVQKEALNNWSKGFSETQKYAFPKLLCTEEEANEMSEIMNNVETYMTTMVLKYITGAESFDNYDAFIEQMKKFNIEKAISYYQSAYERYEQR